jgi:putative membrane protein
MKTIAKKTKNALHVIGSGIVLILFNVAATPSPGETERQSVPATALWHCFLFGLLGVLMVVVGFKVFDWLLRRIDVEGEVAKGNIAAAVLGASVVLGISMIIASAIH